ncbi:MAG: response regulator, partial [Algicola sp.]|nr:response regulator [Algicola sp.]
SLSDNDVRSILEDAAGNLWIGTLNGGLNLLNRQTNTFVHYRHNANDTNSVTDGFISIIHEDSLGHLWIGTANGLNRYNPISKNFTRFTHVADDPTSISHNTIYALYTAQDGSLWVGTGGGGLNHFNHQSQTFTRYQHNPDNANSLSHNTVYSIDQDPQGNFWIGTDGGLNRFDAKTNAFTHYREKDGLPSDSVLTVQGDKNGNLWLGAGGISLFDPTSATFRNGIGASAGCSSGGQGANYQATDGKLYFGHCSFYPSQAIVPSQPPQVVFTDFRLLNKSVAINGDNSPTVLTQVINQTEAITLSHEDNILSFEFAALHYVDPKKNKYRYKLDGFNKDWIETAADNRRATFTNLAAGDYTFRVKASNHKGVWSEQDRSIKLTVTPAPWFTWWAKSFYVLVAFSLFGTVVYLNHLRHRAIIRSQQNAELANQAKSIFVANISHEIRTPLNAVLGYTQMLEREPGLADQYKQKISIIDRSGHHLLALINDILDISKMEANAMELHEVDFELVDLIEGIAVMFDGRCAEKHLDWRFVNQVDNHIAVHGDQGKLRQILINLLGNAVKFTAKGSVTLTLSCQNPDHYHFEVADSGIGIALHEQVSIFRAFSQTTEGAKHGGTGLGLAIASKQVKLMGGQLKLTSTINQGSQFYFTLPLAKADVAIEARHSRQLHAIKLAPGVNVSALVVDDVKENRDILTHMLQDVGITVLIAQNGQDALDKLHQADSETEGLPDLIFMDVRMPLMDGVQAFKHIQQDFKDRCPTCIVVTAHAMQSDVEHYLHQGFDHYIAKPFRFEAIYECIHHLLDVDFLYENEDEDEPAQAADTTDFCIPPALYQSIKRSADEYEVSKLEDCLIELGNMGTPGKQLADTLNKYLASYDMTGLLEQLSKLKVKQKAQLSTTSC